jgi:pimeloyl-ACP methyl ester carboxylesterase
MKMTLPSIVTRSILSPSVARVTTVVLIPGLGRGPSDFDDLAGRLRADGFDPLAYDPLPLLGAEVPDGITLHTIAADVAAQIDEPAHLVGHAFGNRVARCLAVDRPDLVRSVTLLAAGGLIPPEPDGQRSLHRSFGAPNAAAAGQRAAVVATPLEDWWLGGSAPLLVVQGVDDRVAVPENGRRLIAEIGDRGRLVELADAGHALIFEQPDVVANAVLAFLRDQEATTAERASPPM